MDSSTLYQPTERSLIWRNTAIAVVVTVIINVILYFIGDVAGWIPDTLPERAEEFSLLAVVLYTAVPLIAGGVLLSLLVGWTSHPVIMFSLIAAVVFIASLFAPLSVAEGSTSFRTLLVVMHVVAAVLGTFLLLRGVADEPE